MKAAKLIRKQTNENEATWEIRMGEKGTGKRIGPIVRLWPQSAKSVEAAEQTVHEIVAQNGLDVDGLE